MLILFLFLSADAFYGWSINFLLFLQTEEQSIRLRFSEARCKSASREIGYVRVPALHRGSVLFVASRSTYVVISNGENISEITFTPISYTIKK